MKPVTIYSTNYCPHCMRAKKLLESKKIAFKDVDLTEDEKRREEMQQKTGWMTVPMIFIGDEFIGGADDLYSLDRSGELDKKLR